MLRRLAILALAIAPAGATIAAQPAPDKRIRQVMERPEFAHALWGMEFYDLGAKKTVSAVNRDRLFVPGSTTKLVTIGTALQLLGADHRFHTRVYRTGPIRNGTIDGDLVLVASGDPNLSGREQEDGTYAFVDEDHSYGGQPLPTDPLTPIATPLNSPARPPDSRCHRYRPGLRWYQITVSTLKVVQTAT